MTDRDARLNEILGDELIRLIDRRTKLWHELEAVSADIYAALVNRVQIASGSALLRPYEALAADVHSQEQRLDHKKEKIADLRMIVEDQERRLKVLEDRLNDGE
jgi:hypothetical protein